MSSSISIFVSHDKEDETLAILLKEFLEPIFLNASVFVSSLDLTGGEVWFEELRDKLNRATAIVAIVTPRSPNSPWVLFEAGAGFCTRKTIPLLADGLTFDALNPPLKLLQGRLYTNSGIRELTGDIAKLADLRRPTKFEGIVKLLDRATEFLQLRREDAADIPSAKAAPPVFNSGKPDVPTFLESHDSELVEAIKQLTEKARTLLVQSIERTRAAFDIPSPDKLSRSTFDDLLEIAQAVGVPFPAGLKLELSMYKFFRNIPAQTDSKWKKINATKHLEDVWHELDRYEASLDLEAPKLET